MNFVAVAIGGFIGAIFRYNLGQWIRLESGFPIGTLIVNLIGCLFLGWFLTITAHKKNISSSVRLGVGTGLLGGFTTFSTFSVETVKLLQNGHLNTALSYIFVSICIGVFAAGVGFKLAKIQERNILDGGRK